MVTLSYTDDIEGKEEATGSEESQPGISRDRDQTALLLQSPSENGRGMDESIPEKLTEMMELVAQVDPTKRFQNRTGAVFIVVDYRRK